MVDEKRFQHESFGFIRASRVNGKAQLFNSAVSHQHFVQLTIGRAEGFRRYQTAGMYGREELIQIAMSEAQFAEFITSMNVGDGAPCTLRYVMGKRMAEPPKGTNTKQTFEAEVKQQVADISASLVDAITKLTALTSKGKAGKGELGEALAAFETVQRELTANLPYMVTTMAAAVEKLTEQAKMELNAHSVMLDQQRSVERVSPPVEIESDWDREAIA